MKNKIVIVCFLISFILISGLVYINYFNNDIVFNNFQNEETINVFSEYEDKEYKVCYGNKFKCKDIKYETRGNVDTNKIGTYKITYSAKYGKVNKKLVKNVNVVDKIKPVLSISGDFNNVCPNGKVNNAIYKALDNYDGDISKNIKYKLENNIIKYKITDSSGNISEKDINITINDSEKPSLILNGDTTIYLAVGEKYIEDGYVAVDNCDGNITEHVKINNNIDTSKPGTYEVYYEVKDEFGNKATAKRIVKVFKKNNYVPGVVSHKTIYLTFDDGPGMYTEKLLGILDKYNVKATFFVVGNNNSKYDYLIKKEYDSGHTVGLHSNTHRYNQIYNGVGNFMDDLLKIEDKVKNLTGVDSKIIRFPGGSSNTISRRYKKGIMTELTKKVEDLGYRYFDWTIISGDAGDTKSTSKIISNVTSSIKENQPNVVLMHDIKSYSVNAVEDIIKYGLSNGYTFAPLTMDSPVIHQKVNN